MLPVCYVFCDKVGGLSGVGVCFRLLLFTFYFQERGIGGGSTVVACPMY